MLGESTQLRSHLATVSKGFLKPSAHRSHGIGALLSFGITAFSDGLGGPDGSTHDQANYGDSRDGSIWSLHCRILDVSWDRYC